MGMPFSKLKVAAGVVLLSIGVCFASSFCMNCGTQLLTGANFCGQCGTVVGGVAETGIPVEIQNIQATPIVAPKTETQKPRFAFGAETEYSFGLGDYGISTFGINLLGGARINQHFSLLFGSGWHPLSVAKTNGITYNSWFEDKRLSLIQEVLKDGWDRKDILYQGASSVIPIFLRPRIYFLRKDISPILDTDIGLGIVILSRLKSDGNVWWGHAHPTFYFNPSFGVDFGGFNVSFGYKLWIAEYERLLTETERIWQLGRWVERIENTGTVRRPNHGLSLKLGWTL